MHILRKQMHLFMLLFTLSLVNRKLWSKNVTVSFMQLLHASYALRSCYYARSYGTSDKYQIMLSCKPPSIPRSSKCFKFLLTQES